jgi:ectoine hydroxylase-related dioxygenase (phytanoyl-CoA dioxygenase family)
MTDTYAVDATDEQAAQFQADGYLRFDRITSPEEVIRLRELYDQVMADSRAFRVVYGGTEKQEKVINQVFLPELVAPEMADTAYLRNGRRLVAELLGVHEEEVTPGGQMLIFKPETGGGEAPWHQDEAYWNDRNNLKCESASVWMPLDDVVVESGCMQFLPGSHRNDVLRHRCEPGEPLVVDEPVDLSTAVACPLPAGGATIHHCRTLHHTAPNTSGRPRRAITTIFHGPATIRPATLEKPWVRGLEVPSQLPV